MQVSKQESEAIKEFMDLGPSYVSSNAVVGEKDCHILFPDNYDSPEEELIETKKRTQKRKSKKNPANVQNAAAIQEVKEGSIMEDVGNLDGKDINETLQNVDTESLNGEIVAEDKATSPIEVNETEIISISSDN